MFRQKIVYLLFITLLTNLIFSQNPKVNLDSIQSSYSVWKEYHSKNIRLSLDFKALDNQNNELSKEEFLNLIISEKWLPIKVESDVAYTYKLFPINQNSDSSIKASLEAESFEILGNFKKEGTIFPKFSFKDINDNLIDNESLKEKIVVIKCWFIHCAPCIKEFPEVNNLADKYKDRNDMVFLSLAEDNTEQLITLLNKKPLHYLVVPNMKDYMNSVLQLNGFPTHFILDKNGKIIKVLSDFKSLEISLEKFLQD